MLKNILLVFSLLFAIACGPEADESPRPLPPPAVKLEPLVACQPMIWETYGAPIFGALNVVVKTVNIGTATCSYKVSVDVYKNGTTYGGTIHNVNSQAPFNGSAPIKSNSTLFNGISRPCTYDVWFKIGTSPWDRDDAGPFWC